jgi:hypothetical protein
MVKIDSCWSSTMMHHSSQNAQQVYCTTGDQGSEWISGLDDLPPPVRRRLAESRFNICPTCVDMEARRNTRGRKRPTISTFFDVIEAIERRLGKQQP